MRGLEHDNVQGAEAVLGRINAPLRRSAEWKEKPEGTRPPKLDS